MTEEPKAEHRIAKLLARAGVASRREIERMIADGRVALDGVALDTPATILRSLRGVTVDGVAIEAAAAAQLFVYHKPPGLLVTEHDPAGRPTIYDRLPSDLPRVVPVGRLDLATEGLLLLTTDGGLKRTLELPATGVERAYRARAYGEITQGMLEDLMDGIEIEGVRYGPINANLERRTGANVWIELILTEGKNREVRRVLEHLGLQVSRLIRTRYGPFILGDLPAGAVGEVRQHDLVAFTKSLKDGRPSDVRVETVAPRAPAPRPAREAEPPRPRREPDAPRRAAPVRAERPPRAFAPAAPAEPVRPGFRARPASGAKEARAARFASEREPRGGTSAPARPDARTSRGGLRARADDQRPAAAGRPDRQPAEPAQARGGRSGFRANRSDDRAASADRPHRDARSGGPATRGDASPQTGFRPSRGDDARPPRRDFGDRTPREADGSRTPRDSDRAPRRADAEAPRPGRTGPRASRPGFAAHKDARGGTAGGWADRPDPGARPHRPGGPSRGKPGPPRRPDGPPRGKR